MFSFYLDLRYRNPVVARDIITSHRNEFKKKKYFLNKNDLKKKKKMFIKNNLTVGKFYKIRTRIERNA